MSIQIIKDKTKRKKVPTKLHAVTIVFRDEKKEKEYKVIEKTLMTILGKRGLDPEYFSISDFYNSPNKNRFLEVAYGRIVGYSVIEGEKPYDDVKIVPNTEKMDLSTLTCNYDKETKTLTITDGNHTYSYTVDNNYRIAENGTLLPNQKYIPTHEEEVQRLRENEEWHREHCRRLHNSMLNASKDIYKD